MVQERLSWSNEFHVGKWWCGMEYGCKIERNFQDCNRQFNMENYAAEMVVNWKDPMVEC